MTTSELEQVTRDYLRDIYKREYIGKIQINTLSPQGYIIKLGMYTPEQPITIYAELSDDKFLKFLKEDLKSRRFNLKYFGELNLVHPYDCSPRNTICGCHD